MDSLCGRFTSFFVRRGRHTPPDVAEYAVLEVARAARLGHRMRGMGNVYEHVARR
jgi:hypothetical protein